MLKSVCLKTFNNNHNCIVNRDKKPYILLFIICERDEESLMVLKKLMNLFLDN